MYARPEMNGAVFAIGVVVMFPGIDAGALAATIPADQAAKHVSQTVQVKGIVAQIGHGPSGAIYLNFGAPYPDETFTAVIFSDDAGRFPGIERAEGKTATVDGTVQLYHGRPEIILRSRDQLHY